MKLVAEHLGEIILAVAGVALVVGVILAFEEPVYNFFTSIIDQFTDIADGTTGDIWNIDTYTPTT